MNYEQLVKFGEFLDKDCNLLGIEYIKEKAKEYHKQYLFDIATKCHCKVPVDKTGKCDKCGYGYGGRPS